MKRMLKGALLTAMLALLGVPAAANARTDGLTLIGAAELHSVTAGICGSKCPKEDDEEEPYVIGYEWVTTRRVDSPAEQLNYSIHTEFSNVYGSKTITYSATVNDQCRNVWLSGGIGISTGFNVSIGRTYRCDQVSTLSGSIAPGYRVKLYRGEMRQVSTITVSEYELWSDGSSEKTGATDTGRFEHRWYRFTPVTVKGN